MRKDCSLPEIALMRIKKSKNNEYIRAGGVWVRNFTKPYVSSIAISNLVGDDDYHRVIYNESVNVGSGYNSIAEEKNIRFKKVVIISNGYQFEQKHRELLDFPSDVFVIAVNGALRNWKLMSGIRKRPINCYVVNNPYNECFTFMPHKSSLYFPTCVASVRTNPEFLKKYAGNVYTYEPTPEKNFGVKSRVEKYYIDDYRNTVCAAIGLAYQFGVRKLLLMCCDDSLFEKQKDAAVQLENGLWTYPQQLKSHEIIDANLYWLTHDKLDKVVAANYSCGPKYNNATYIDKKENALEFFEDSEGDTNEETNIIT
jgi:hypothetical protein